MDEELQSFLAKNFGKEEVIIQRPSDLSNEWEVGIGTYTSSGTTLSRDTILESSNSGSAVNFSAGTKDVFVTYPAEKAIYEGNLPTKLSVYKRDATTADVALANGFLPVLNRSGSTINVTVS